MSSRFPERRVQGCLLLALLVITAVAPVTRASQRQSDILADGSDDRFWIARVGRSPTPDQSIQTSLFVRNAGTTQWRQIAQIPGRALGLGHRGTQLAALFEGGAWTMIGDDGTLSDGPPLPGDGKLLALAGAGDTFWGIGEFPPASPTSMPASKPATAPATAPASRPTTAPITGVVLFELVDGVWTPRAQLPEKFVGSVAAADLSIVDRSPYVSILESDKVIHLLRLEKSSLVEVQQVPAKPPIVEYQLISGVSSPVAWMAQQGQPYELAILGDQKMSTHTVANVPPTAANCCAAYAMGRIRVLWAEAGSTKEQLFDLSSGSQIGTPQVVPFPNDAYDLTINRWVEFVIWGAILFAIFSAMRLRRTMGDVVLDLQKLQLANPVRRLASGSIDLLPLIVGTMLLLRPNLSIRFSEFLLLGATALYITHTTISEVFTGRTLGKWLMGLSVVGLDAGPPTKGALLVRNLLRIIDIGLLLMPLVVVLFSPLRQRTGDVAAGTLVVRDKSETE